MATLELTSTNKEPAAEEAAAEKYPAKEPLLKRLLSKEISLNYQFTIAYIFRCLLSIWCFPPQFLKSYWLEARKNKSITYFQKGSVEVTAESWDIEVLLILLRTIHGQYYRIPRKLTLEMLAKIAVIADYYECREALYFLTDMWIKNVEEKIPTAVSRNLILWLWIAWFFSTPFLIQIIDFHCHVTEWRPDW